MKLIEPNFKINLYPMYGLNRNRSFLQAQVCDCGCKKPMYLQLKTKEDVKNFCFNVLREYDCSLSGIFAVFDSGIYMAVWKQYDEELEDMTESDDMHMFSEIDGKFRLCCYNLIIEERPGEWMIQS